MFGRHHKCKCEGECLAPTSAIPEISIRESVVQKTDNAPIKNLEPPPPDLNMKPKDIEEFSFGFACENHHSECPFDDLKIDAFGERKVCSKCGGVSKPAVIKKICEARWEKFSSYDQRPPSYWWRQSNGIFGTIWSRFEFVRFLTLKEVTSGKTLHK